MILKSFQLNKVDIEKNNFLLFYGNNDGQKREEIDKIFKKYVEKKMFQYDANELLNNKENFISEILNQSLFGESKLIVINRATEKILPIVEEINAKKTSDLFIINTGSLEKKSKLRNYFEKKSDCICTAFYPDTPDTLIKLASNFMKINNLSLSRENMNLIVRKSNGDRNHLKVELEKIKLFSKDKKITSSQLMKLINLGQNHEISDIVNNCLSKNKKNLMSMLNENLITTEDSILMIRTFLNKSKRLLKLISDYQVNKNLNELIVFFKPPIFWKEKEIIKNQITKWSLKDIKKLICDLNDLELEIKKNGENSVNFLMNFLIEKST